MNIVILGPGAIGRLWAYQLHKSGHQVALWGTQPAGERCLILDDLPPITLAYNQPATLEQADLLLVCVKAWQVETALLPLLDKLAPQTILLFIHNGMGALDTLTERLSDYPLLMATTTHGALKQGAHHVMHTGQGTTQLGAVNAQGERCDFLVDVLNHAFSPVLWTENIHHALWQKLAINCAINPLTAINNCRNGELMKANYQPLIKSLIAEIVSVMQAEKIPVDQQALSESICRVIEATSDNYSSMQQDVAHQRPTEIDFITGYVIKKAAQHGLAVPVNQSLYRHIHSLQQRWTP
ncbi:2-dehydropantoate 2-reductase [Vibrio sp. A11]|uniref:2-dehydropantoate 2-reductase n=1 Tax=Vibrio sp. A11 TaxID=2591464 RepID=UPI00148234F1|nr:2-dehydropantoate 2-reductase [Vibrio sp. A11]NNN61298.1 2-dehydropantoate 2-reductase [Vibrio sp. A11]